MTVLSVENHMRRAKSLIKKGRVNDAKILYEQLLKKFPKNQKAQKALANLSRIKKKFNFLQKVKGITSY